MTSEVMEELAAVKAIANKAWGSQQEQKKGKSGDPKKGNGKPAQSHKSCGTVDYTPISVEPHRPTQGVWPIATVANDSQLHLAASSI